MFGKREQIFLNSGHLKLNMLANTFGVTTNIVEKDRVYNFQNSGMEIYGGRKETNNKQIIIITLYINFIEARKRKWYIRKKNKQKTQHNGVVEFPIMNCYNKHKQTKF